MIQVALRCLLVAVGLTACRGQPENPILLDDPPAEEILEPVAKLPGEIELEQLLAGWKSYRSGYYADRRKATVDQRIALSKRHRQALVEFASDGLRLAALAPQTAAADEVLTEVVRNDAPGTDLPRVLQLLAEHHLGGKTNPGYVVGNLARNPATWAAHFVEQVVAKSPHAAVREKAQLSLARILLRQASIGERLRKDWQKQRKIYARYHSADSLEHMRKLDLAANRRRAEQLLDAVVADHSETTGRRKPPTQVVRARAELFAIRQLAIGQPVPEIVGEDLFGKAMKLSEFRGKVVVLDFWGDW